MTTACTLPPRVPAISSTVSSSLPMPSPPPTSSTAGTFFGSPSRALMRGLGGSGFENTGRIGSPCCTSCSELRPLARPSSRQKSVGTKQRVTPAWNHVLWHVVKSVTTVAKLIGCMSFDWMRERSTWSGTCCIMGWTDTTRSGLKRSNASPIALPMKACAARRYGTCTHLGCMTTYEAHHRKECCTRKLYDLGMSQKGGGVWSIHMSSIRIS
mmetsp:Transcript_33368/g.99360  ORF Transcript_33368/g.99360 Transcript_33368/m.99360 type:complete len:212 (+) Transcript_33368:916-1551(+)